MLRSGFLDLKVSIGQDAVEFSIGHGLEVVFDGRLLIEDPALL